MFSATSTAADRPPGETSHLDVGLIYSHPWIYRAFMQLIYGRDFFARYEVVAAHTPSGASVVDLCCGGGALAPLLEAKGCSYLGLDLNPRFVQWGRKRGRNLQLWDARTDEIPEADVVCVQSSLYHFMPEDRAFVERMLAKARRFVIVMEPVQNFSASSNPLLKNLALRWTGIDGRSFADKHDSESFRALARAYGAEPVYVAGGREMLAVFEKSRA